MEEEVRKQQAGIAAQAPLPFLAWARDFRVLNNALV